VSTAGYTDIARSIAAEVARQSREKMAAKREADKSRDVGAMALQMNFYSKAEIDKPYEDGSIRVNGKEQHYAGRRWCVWLMRWTGREWRKVKRVSGPMPLNNALYARLREECARRKLDRVPE
jgi:hypothetical protein